MLSTPLDISNRWSQHDLHPQARLESQGSCLVVFSAAEDGDPDRRPIFLLTQEETCRLILFLREGKNGGRLFTRGIDGKHARMHVDCLNGEAHLRVYLYNQGDSRLRGERGIYARHQLLAVLESIQAEPLVRIR